MKPKIIGIIILAVAAIAAGLFMLFTKKTQSTQLNGYLGGEKIGLFEDEEFTDYIKKTIICNLIIHARVHLIW